MAAIVAQVVFWVLFLGGVWIGGLSRRVAAIIVAAYVAALFSGAYRPYWLPFSSCVAVLDIVMVFIVAQGDIRLT